MNDVLSNMPLVCSIANRHRDSGVPIEDLVNAGVIGLLYAVNNHDPSRGSFESYAPYPINSHITKESRKNSVMPRKASVIRDVRRLHPIIQRLTHELGREPYLEEIVKASGMKKTAVEIATRNPIFLHMDGPTVEDVDVRLEISELLERLDDFERLVIDARYYEGLTLKEAGEKLECSRECIRQTQKRAIRKMR